MQDFTPFLEDLTSSKPTPGGGSVAALQASMAAALLGMVANLTLGRKRYADVQEEATAIRDASVRLRDRARLLVVEDTGAYSQVGRALGMPRATDDEKSARDSAIQEALKGAAVPPLETMRVACEIAILARQLVRIGNKSAISDVGTAVLAARAAHAAGKLNVDINLAGVRDSDWVDAVRKQVDEARWPESVAADVLKRVHSVIAGEPG